MKRYIKSTNNIPRNATLITDISILEVGDKIIEEFVEFGKRELWEGTITSVEDDHALATVYTPYGNTSVDNVWIDGDNCSTLKFWLVR